MMEMPKLILTHIPRTGGTSLLDAIKLSSPTSKLREFSSLTDLALMSDEELNSYDVISTYSGTKIFDRLQGDWTKVVILREPRARLASSYWYLRNTETSSTASSPARSLSYAEYLASRDPQILPHTWNIQTWTLLGDKSLSFRRSFFMHDEEALLSSALKRSELYDFIGFTESLDGIWKDLCNHFDWPCVPLPQARKNHGLLDLDEPSDDDLKFHTGLDCLLVDRVRSLVLPT